jgi:uncharacterized protein
VEWFWTVLYLVSIWVGVLISLFGLPGPFLIAAAAALAGYLTRWKAAQLWLVIVFFLLALLAEVFDQWLGASSARSYGSRRPGMWGCFMGGLAGALIGLPVPFFGSLLGAFLGAFAGATLLELLISRAPFKSALRAGYGAFRGRLGATLFKSVLALSMAVSASLVLWNRIF